MLVITRGEKGRSKTAPCVMFLKGYPLACLLRVGRVEAMAESKEWVVPVEMAIKTKTSVMLVYQRIDSCEYPPPPNMFWLFVGVFLVVSNCLRLFSPWWSTSISHQSRSVYGMGVFEHGLKPCIKLPKYHCCPISTREHWEHYIKIRIL